MGEVCIKHGSFAPVANLLYNNGKLHEYALRVCCVVNVASSAERNWSLLGFIHLKTAATDCMLVKPRNRCTSTTICACCGILIFRSFVSCHMAATLAMKMVTNNQE